MKLRRPGHEWLAYIELVKFVETMLLTAFGVLAPEPWRGVIRMRKRLPEAAVGQLRAVLPSAPEEAELRRALRAALDGYLAVRPRLAADRGMPLADDLAIQILAVIRPERLARADPRSSRP